MANPNQPWKFRTLLAVCLSVLVTLTACSGGNPQVNPAIKDTSLESRQAAGQELQKAADGIAPLLQGELPGKDDPGLTAPAAGEPPAGEPPAPVTAAAPALAPLDLSQPPAATADPSLPVEPRVGARAPEFSLQTLDGQNVSMAQLIGRPVVISYWATWCIPCQQELPILQGLAQEYQSSGLTVLTVNAIDQDSTDKVQAMLAEKSLSLPVLLDQGSAFANDYQAIFFPTTFYIDPAGVIRFIKLGDSSEADLRAHVEGLLRGDL
jgi:peroxiredoxin